MAQLSACLIVKNEEKNLGNCLASLKPFTDEIIIVDTGSTDKTIQVAESYGCKIFRIKWPGNFSEARNEALKHASGKWILSIDADEILDAPRNLKELISKAPENTGGFFVERHNRFCNYADGKLSTEARSNLRLFRNHPTIKWKRNVHEQISDSITDTGFLLESIPAKIIHFIYPVSEKQLKEKNTGYLKLLNESLKNNPTDAYSLFFRSQTYLLFENKKTTISELNEIVTSAEGNVLFLAMNALCALLAEKKRLKEAVALSEKSITAFPRQSWAYFLNAVIWLEQKEYEKALVSIDKAVLSLEKINEREKVGGDMFLLREQKHCFKGNCFLRSGRLNEAEKEFKAGAVDDFNGNESRMGLAVIALIHGKKQIAKKHLEDILRIEPEWKKAKDLLKKLN